MAKVNFRQQKRQREMARKERQAEKLLKRGERPAEEAAATLVGEVRTSIEQLKPPAGGES